MSKYLPNAGRMDSPRPRARVLRESLFESVVAASLVQGNLLSERNGSGIDVAPISWDERFRDIAPHLARIDTLYGTKSIAKVSATGTDTTGTTIPFNSNFIPLYDNFYLSDVITKSSITMGKCSAQSQNNTANFF